MSDLPNVGEKRKREEVCLTLDEITAQQIQLEEEANSVLQENWGQEDMCTYSQGYLSQNIYACETCQSDNSNQSSFGFCFGCSLQCHLNHKVYELFNKRHFRCDCGLNRCGTCELEPKPSDAPNNEENIYNQNFQDLYCFCHSGYDPDNDEMIQCYVCQDWFHTHCIEKTSKGDKIEEKTEEKTEEKEKNVDTNEEIVFQYLPENRDSIVFICYECMDKHPFLYDYTNLQILPPGLSNITSEIGNSDSCKRPKAQQSLHYNSFWNFGWRDEICKCDKCLEMYENENISYIVTEEDPDSSEISLDTSISSSLDQKWLEGVTQRVPDAMQQREILYGINELSNAFREYIAPFAQSGTVITEEHIQEFIEKMGQKRRKRE